MREKKAQGRPFFAALFNYTVHWPMEAPQPLIEKYKDRPKQGFHDHRYAAMIEAMDQAIGRVLDSLEEMKITDQTLVVFASDNGAFGGVGDCRPLRECKGYLYEGGIRVPMIARWPNTIRADSVSHVPVISTDLFATLVEVAGLKADPATPADGESLVPIFQGADRLNRDALFWHYPNFAFHKKNRLGSAVRIGDHKLIEWLDDGTLELYDLANDLGETKNLAMQNPSLAAEMRRRLDQWRKDSGAKMPVPR